MKNNLSLKEKILVRIKNNKGNVSPVKVLLLLLQIPIYIVYFLIASIIGEFPKRKKGI